MKTLSISDQHRKAIALKTLKMTPVMASIMGGTTFQEAINFLTSIGYTKQQIKNLSK